MRRALLILVAVLAAAVAVSACGSSKKAGASNPKLDALAYFPRTTPFVSTIVTDPQSTAVQRLKQLQQRTPALALVTTALIGQLSKQNIDFNRDVKPLFGNPVVFGITSVQNLQSDNPPVLAAWRTRNQTALKRLISKATLHGAGKQDDFSLYETADKQGAVAVSGPTVLLASTLPQIKAALTLHDKGQGFTADELSRDTAGLDPDAPVQMMGDLTAALSNAKAAEARRIPWVAAIRGYGASLGLSASGFSTRIRIDTTARKLTTAQLPFAAGATAPSLAAPLPISASVRDPRQIWTFGKSVAQIVNPTDYASFTNAEKTIKDNGLDVEKFVSLLSGDLQLTSDTRITAARAELSDPGFARAQVKKLYQLSQLGKSQVTSLGGGFYSVPSNGVEIVYGIVGNQLVAGRATPAQLRAYARTQSTPAAGGTGAIAMKIALAPLARLRLGAAPSQAEQQIISALGDLTGSAQVTPSGLTLSATLGLK